MKKQKIIYVAGHKYPHGDTGATIPETTEARQNVEMVDEVVALQYKRPELDVLMVPHKLGGQAEINWVNQHADKDTLVISIHHNACEDESVSGVEAFYYSGNNKGAKLASLICFKISEKTGIKHRGAKIEDQSQHESIGIISKTKGTAVLVECGFLTNSYDKNYILDPVLDNAFAEAIDEAVTEFLGVVMTYKQDEDLLEGQNLSIIGKNYTEKNILEITKLADKGNINAKLDLVMHNQKIISLEMKLKD